jgi:hypothetical protein
MLIAWAGTHFATRLLSRVSYWTRTIYTTSQDFSEWKKKIFR